MKRRAPDEHVEPFRERLVRPDAETLRDRLADLGSSSTLDALRDAWPEMPDGITDRAADVWEPLLAIADAAGGDWPERARDAAVALNNARAERDPSLGVQLLADCRRIFADQRRRPAHHRGARRSAHRARRVTLGRPARQTDSTHAASPAGSGSTTSAPATTASTTAPKRGYRLEDFHDAWQRYLPPVADVADVADVQREREARERCAYGG